MAIAVTALAAWAKTAATGNSITSNTFDLASGDLVILIGAGDDSGSGPADQPFDDAITDTATPDLSWNVITSSGAGSSGYLKAWWAIAGQAYTGITATATKQNTDATTRALIPYKVTGHDPADPIGNVWNTSNTSTTNNWSPNTYTSSVNNSRGMAAAIDWNALGTPASTDTEAAEHTAGSISWLSAYKAADTATSGTTVAFNFDAAGSSAADWRAIAWEINPAASGGTVNTQTLSDTISVTDEPLDYVFFNRPLTDTVVVADEGLDYAFFSRLLDSLTTVTDGAIRSQIFGAYFTDTLTVADELQAFMVRGRVAESLISVTDEALAQIIGNNILTRILSSNIDVMDSSVLSIIRNRLLQDAIDITDPGVETFTTTNLTLTDEVVVTDGTLVRLLLTRLLGDSLDVSDSAIAALIGQNIITKVLTSTILTADDLQWWISRYRLGESAVLTTDQIIRVLSYTRELIDTLETTDETMTALQRFILLTDAISVQDSFSSLILTPTTDNPVIRIGFDQPRIDLGGYAV